MLTLLEVRQPTGIPDNPMTLAARLDLTENTEVERQEVLTNARILYGNNANYLWHFCGHDEGKQCRTSEA